LLTASADITVGVIAVRDERITGKDYSLQALFEGPITYTIDYYQREYAWSADDVRILVEDLCSEYRKYSRSSRRGERQKVPPYFLGPFVFFEDEEEHSRYLVDGQQRFTTLHLIFILTRRLLQDLGAPTESAMLDTTIRTFAEGEQRYRIAIPERVKALDAFYEGRRFEPPQGSTLSVRNLVQRGREIQELLDQHLDADSRPEFAVWLLNNVVMVGIRSPSKDSAYRIFETMNDRGARLTSVDLLKSYLLSHVRREESALNDRWRRMLGELTGTRNDHDAPSRFIKSALIAKHAGVNGDIAADINAIETALNVWVQSNPGRLGLKDDRRYFKFVDELIELATRYNTFLAAAKKHDQHHGLETIYFNEINGLTSQMILILAAIRHDDPPTEAKDKARRVASFIDRWFVLRIIDDLPVQQYDLNELIIRLLDPLRACVSAQDVTNVLAREVADEDTPFMAFRTYGKRGNNSRQVRYLLARITAFVATSLGKPNEIGNYLNADHPWQIEHIFANHQERHPEIEDPLVFRALRDRLGVLVLLRDRDNNSLNDLTYEVKVKRYPRQNDLVAILNPEHRNSNPDLRDFIKTNHLESLLRSFGPKETLQQVTEVRQDLYFKLCQLIWDPERLQLRDSRQPRLPEKLDAPRAEPQPKVTKTGKGRKKLLQGNVAKMIRAGVIARGEKLVGRNGEADYWAYVDDDGAIVLSATEVRYTKIDDSAREVCQKPTRGMDFWHQVRPDGSRTSLRVLFSALP
jgi:hypothetical protein